jgi:hypothetical protein
MKMAIRNLLKNIWFNVNPTYRTLRRIETQVENLQKNKNFGVKVSMGGGVKYSSLKMDILILLNTGIV